MGETYQSQILATSSIGGFVRLKGEGFAYITSKLAVTHLMKMLATTLVPFKIRSNVFAPGLFPSDMAEPIIKKVVSPEGVLPGEIIPAERLGGQEDVEGMILYLASRAGAYVNGNIMVVDGGWMANLQSTY